MPSKPGVCRGWGAQSELRAVFRGPFGHKNFYAPEKVVSIPETDTAKEIGPAALAAKAFDTFDPLRGNRALPLAKIET